jgi:hypothetical protein
MSDYSAKLARGTFAERVEVTPFDVLRVCDLAIPLLYTHVPGAVSAIPNLNRLPMSF